MYGGDDARLALLAGPLATKLVGRESSRPAMELLASVLASRGIAAPELPAPEPVGPAPEAAAEAGTAAASAGSRFLSEFMADSRQPAAAAVYQPGLQPDLPPAADVLGVAGGVASSAAWAEAAASMGVFEGQLNDLPHSLPDLPLSSSWPGEYDGLPPGLT